MHRTAPFASGGLGSVIFHGDPLSCVNHFDRQRARGMALEAVAKFVAITYQNDPVTELSGCLNGTLDLGGRGFVAPHRVYCNGDHSLRLSRLKMIRGTLFGCGLNDFAPFVLATFGANTVRNLGFVAIRAFGVSRLAEGVM